MSKIIVAFFPICYSQLCAFTQILLTFLKAFTLFCKHPN